MKGGKYEREICYTLSKWWGGGRTDIFWRTSQSGGRATNRRKKGQDTHNQHGDICATDPIGLPFLKAFAVEIKRGYNKAFDLMTPLDKDESTAVPLLEQWIEQAVTSQKGSKARHWMIIYRRDRRDTMVMYPMGLHAWLDPNGYAGEPTFYPSAVMAVETKNFFVEFKIMRLDAFLRYLNPDELKRKIEGKK